MVTSGLYLSTYRELFPISLRHALSPPTGNDATGAPVFLKDIWPTRAEVQEVERKHVLPAMFKEVYEKITVGGGPWGEEGGKGADVEDRILGRAWWSVTTRLRTWFLHRL